MEHIYELQFDNGIHITWNRGDDGGGSYQYNDFLSVITKKYKTGLEWCSGLSAIGFSLLDAGVVEEIVLMDVYKPALEQALINATSNNISDKVRTYQCDMIKKIPLQEKFDLVVGNPPHTDQDDWIHENREVLFRLTVDKDWKIHEEFFSNIRNYLNLNADIFLSEIRVNPTLIEMAENNGLVFKAALPAPMLAKFSDKDAHILHFKYEKEIH